MLDFSLPVDFGRLSNVNFGRITNTQTIMKTIQSSTNLFPILNLGMYNSSLDPDRVFSHDGWEYEDFSPVQEVSNFNFSKYKEDVAEIAGGIMKDIFSEYGDEWDDFGILGVEPGGIWSPSSYNYRTDEMDFKVQVSDDFEQIAREHLESWKDDEEVSKFLRRNYTSYDGFLSFTSNTVQQLLELKNVEDINAYFCLVAFKTGYFDRSYHSAKSCKQSFQYDLEERVFEDLNEDDYNEYSYIADEDLCKMYEDDQGSLWKIYEKVKDYVSTVCGNFFKYESEWRENYKDILVGFLHWCKKQDLTFSKIEHLEMIPAGNFCE